MSVKNTLVRNIKQLSKAVGCEDNGKKLTEYINEKAAGERPVLDRSYMSRLLKNSPSDPANITMDRLEGIAKGLGVEPWQLINPVGFDEDGKSLANLGSIDTSSMAKAVSYARNAQVELGLSNDKFLIECISKTYEAMVTNNEGQLPIILAKLARSY